MSSASYLAVVSLIPLITGQKIIYTLVQSGLNYKELFDMKYNLAWAVK